MKKRTPLNPAARVIHAFGGAGILAAAIGRDPSRVHRWSYPVEVGGTGGAIPGGSKMIARIMKAALDRDVELTLEELIEDREKPRRSRKRAA